ncbi:unnamed protein product [Discosporangium mesarthrocarpum]
MPAKRLTKSPALSLCAALESDLREVFGRFGPIFDLKLIRPTSEERSPYAFITYYSAYHARTARDHLDKKDICGKKGVRVQPRNTVCNRKKRLSTAQCIECANAFLGFNGWKCELLGVWKQKSSEKYSLQNPVDGSPVQHVAHVRITLPDRRAVEGYGVVSSAEADSGGEPSHIMKSSVAAARLAAFSQLRLVILDGVCRYVHVLPPPAEIPTERLFHLGTLSNK